MTNYNEFKNNPISAEKLIFRELKDVCDELTALTTEINLHSITLMKKMKEGHLSWKELYNSIEEIKEMIDERYTYVSNKF